MTFCNTSYRNSLLGVLCCNDKTNVIWKYSRNFLCYKQKKTPSKAQKLTELKLQQKVNLQKQQYVPKCTCTTWKHEWRIQKADTDTPRTCCMSNGLYIYMCILWLSNCDHSTFIDRSDRPDTFMITMQPWLVTFACTAVMVGCNPLQRQRVGHRVKV